jgi:hypothetical protein
MKKPFRSFNGLGFRWRSTNTSEISRYAAYSTAADWFAMSLIVNCADIGSVSRGNFGWARLVIDERNPACTAAPHS